MSAVEIRPEQQTRNERAAREYPSYSFRCLNFPGEYPVDVTTPGGTYTVTERGCSCEDSRYSKSICKHELSAGWWLAEVQEAARLKCPKCDVTLVVDYRYTGPNGYLLTATCAGCGYRRVL